MSLLCIPYGTRISELGATDRGHAESKKGVGNCLKKPQNKEDMNANGSPLHSAQRPSPFYSLTAVQVNLPDIPPLYSAIKVGATKHQLGT